MPSLFSYSRRATVAGFSLVFWSCALASAADWPNWRGPHQDGTTDETDLPLKWDAASSNVKWKVRLPERGNSTPIIWGDKLFLTQALEKEDKRLLLCLDKKSGKELWRKEVVQETKELTHATNPYASASPVTDGTCVIVAFGSAGLFAYDLQGKELWKRTDLGELRHIWGYGSSPVIAGDRVFYNFGPGENTRLLCFDKKTGRTIWEHKEPGGNAGEGASKKWLGSWCDPLLVKNAAGSEELCIAYPNRVCALDPQTGKELWTCAGPTNLVYNSLLTDGDTLIAMCGYGGAALAVKTGGKGDVTDSHRVWFLPKVSQRIGSGVVYEGHHYILSDGGIAECRSLKDGNLLWQERLRGPGPTSQNWSSLVRSGDKLYAVNQGGDAFVFKASPTFALLATNSLGERVIASIAVSDGQLYIRGYMNLWCIGK